MIDAEGIDEISLKEKIRETNQIPFDLAEGDLFKVYLYKKSEENYIMLISLHHIVSDGWSIGIMIDEIIELYEAETEERQPQLSPLTKSFSDFVEAEQDLIKSESGEKQWDYWKEELRDELPVLDLPVDRNRPDVLTYNGATENFSLEKNLVAGLKQLSQSEGATLFATLLAAYQIFLFKFTGQDDIITGIPTGGRNQPDFKNIIGYFINPVAIRSDLSDNPSFRIFLSSVKKKIFGAISNQDFPFALIVERLLEKREPSRPPVFQTFFGIQKIQNNEMQEMIVPNNNGVKVKWGSLVTEPFYISQQEGQFDLTLEFSEGKNLFSGAFKYNTDLFEKETIRQMTKHFKILLENIISHPEKKISELNLLSDEERDLILNKWNNTDFKFDKFECVHRLFEEQVKKTPDRTALVFEEQSLTYKELNSRANQLANYLTKLGVKPEKLVGICVERSPEMVIGILGILKAGGAYIPIDTNYPQSRTGFMISDSGAEILITQKNLTDNLPGNISKVILIDEDWKDISKQNETDFESNVDFKNPAYVIYTSGSTGKPKGVMINHDSLSNHMLWMVNEFKFDSGESVLQKTPFSFDASVWEFYLPLMIGGKLVIAKPDGHLDTAYLTETIQKNNITILQLVPSLLNLLLDENGIENCKSLKTVFSGGEALTFELKEKFFHKLNAGLYNLYGPTEVTIDSVFYKCERKDKTIPIGKPVYNTSAYIVDKYLNPVPAGIQGELLLGGIEVARGYVNNEALTSEKFVDNIFNNRKGKLYKTGDLVKYGGDGNIYFLGRIDRQVKLRGFRIEPGEIESKLSGHPGIKEASVIVREDKPGNQRLAAYVVVKKNETVSDDDLKNFLRESLPEYMVPNAFVFLEQLPILPNGKIDRAALPFPEVNFITEGNEFTEPKLPVETILANIWKEVLGLERISINDNFFRLGGDSIISIQIISKANQMGVKITPKQIFKHQTISSLANVAEYSVEQTAEQGIVTGQIPLTPIQRWFFEQNFTEPNHYNHSVLLKVPKGLSEEYLKQALTELIKHHDALRLRFELKDKEWLQFNEGISGNIPFSSEDVSKFSNAEFKNDIENQQKDIDISKGKLVKVKLYKTGNDEYDRLLILIHHLCIDGISWRIILEDFNKLYYQLNKGEKVKLPPKTMSYKEWSSKLVEHSTSEKLLKEKNFWMSVVELYSKKLPFDLLNEKNENTVESEDTIIFELDESSTLCLLKDVPKTYHTRINDILLTALAIVCSKLTGKNRLLVDLERHGRENITEDIDLSRTVGWFTSISPVVLEIRNADNIGDSIKLTKENLRHIPAEGIGFGLLKYISNDERVKSKLTEFDNSEIIFNYLGQFNQRVTTESDWLLGEQPIILSQNKKNLRKYLLEINSMIINNKLIMEFNFSKNVQKKETIIEFAKMYEDALKIIIEHCTSTEAGGYTPSDFSAAGLNQQELDNLLANIN